MPANFCGRIKVSVTIGPSDGLVPPSATPLASLALPVWESTAAPGPVMATVGMLESTLNCS